MLPLPAGLGQALAVLHYKQQLPAATQPAQSRHNPHLPINGAPQAILRHVARKFGLHGDDEELAAHLARLAVIEKSAGGPSLWAQLGPWPQRLHLFTRLQWLFRLTWWGVNQLGAGWAAALRVVEGAGYVGWMLVFFVMTYLLVR